MEFVEIFKEFVKPELIILIPVLYLVGMGIKRTSLKDSLIPIFLGIIAIGLSALYVFATSDIHNGKDIAMAVFTALTQGVLMAGGSVYFNQIYKQLSKN